MLQPHQKPRLCDKAMLTQSSQCRLSVTCTVLLLLRVLLYRSSLASPRAVHTACVLTPPPCGRGSLLRPKQEMVQRQGTVDTTVVMWADYLQMYAGSHRAVHTASATTPRSCGRGSLLHPEQALDQRHGNADTMAVMWTDAMLVGFKRTDRHTVSQSARRNTSSLYTPHHVDRHLSTL